MSSRRCGRSRLDEMPDHIGSYRSITEMSHRSALVEQLVVRYRFRQHLIGFDVRYFVWNQGWSLHVMRVLPRAKIAIDRGSRDCYLYY